jgi:hypothetical protein
MQNFIRVQPQSGIRLWGLIHEDRYADSTGLGFGCLFSKAYISGGQPVEGLLLFTSPLHAEIYRQRLQALGNRGWRRICMDDRDAVNIIRGVQERRLQIWVVVGFSAAWTQQLLLDKDRLLMASCVGINVRLLRDREGPALRFPAAVVQILRGVIAKGHAPLAVAAQSKSAEWRASDDDEWNERAAKALDGIATLEYANYQSEQENERPALALALFDQDVREWLFIGGTASRQH